MHTEDDTLDALRRIPFQEMKRKMLSARISGLVSLEPVNLDELCKDNGWTRDEYDAELLGSYDPSYEGIITKPHNPYKATHRE